MIQKKEVKNGQKFVAPFSYHHFDFDRSQKDDTVTLKKYKHNLASRLKIP